MTSFFYKAKLKYNGLNYKGWQIQPDGVRTVQGELNKALRKISKIENVKSIGSGRTDAGVHALGQVVKIEIDKNIPEEGLFNALNSFLPNEIRIIEIESCDSEFQPVFDAKWKEYVYLFHLEESDPFEYDRIANFSHLNINVDKIKEALDCFVGEHDFKNYQCVGTDVRSTVREIFKVEFSSRPYEYFGRDSKEVFSISIVGSGFLKQMVRLMVGAVLNYASSKITLDQIKNSLGEDLLKDRLGPVAPAEGLYLSEVGYYPFSN